MAETSAVFHAPLTYLDTDKLQVVIGPSEISFVDGELKVDAKHQAALAWLNYLVSTGVITPAPPGTEPAKTAMLLRSTIAGSAGNDIQVDIHFKEDGFDITVTQKNIYAGLKPEELPEILGTDQTPGTRPGLLRIKHEADKPPQLPGLKEGATLEQEIRGRNAVEETEGTEGAEATRGSWAVPLEPDTAGSTKVAFTLEARDPGEEPIKTTIKLAGPQKLTLEACWTKTASVTSSGSAAIEDALKEFGHVLTASKPGKDGYAAPQGGTFKLQGGLDSTFASLSLSAKK